MDGTSNAPGFRVGLAAACLLVAAMAIPAAQGKVYVHNDLGSIELPSRSFLARALAAGDRTDWCPHLFGGFYFLGEGSGVLHPLNRCLYGALPLDLAFNVEIVWPYPVMLTGFLLLMLRWGVRRDAAVVGAMVYAFGGYHLVHYIHTTVMAAVAHTPWLLLAIDVALRDEDPRRARLGWVGVSLLTASQVLISHVQFVWISSLAESCYAMFLAWNFPVARRRLAGLAAAKGFGAMGGAAQLLPIWEAFSDSTRERPSRLYVAMGSVPPLNLLQWVAPYLTVTGVVTPPLALDAEVLPPAATTLNEWRVHEFALYPGAAVSVLLAWLAVRGSAPSRLRTLATMAALFAVGGLVLAFGNYTPLFELVRRAPVIGRFRVPGRHLTIFQLGVAALTAFAHAGLCEASERRERIPWRRLWPLGLPALAGLSVCLATRLPDGLWPSYLRGRFLAPATLMAAGPLLTAVAGVLAALAARGSRGALLALPVFLAVDQAAYGLRAVSLTPPTELASFLAARPSPPGPPAGRVAFSWLHPGWQDPYMINDLRMTTGYLSMPPRRHLSYRTLSSLRVAGVGWVLPALEEKAEAWWPISGALPRVRLVTRTRRSVDPERDLDAIDVETTALTDRPVPPLPDSPPGLARLLVDRPGKLDVATDAGSRQFLIVSESHHPGWRARVDGRSCEVFRADGDFLGCVVPAGTHRVTFRFRPWSESAGLWFSALGIGLTVAVPVLTSTRERRDRGRGIPPPHAPVAEPHFSPGRTASVEQQGRL